MACASRLFQPLLNPATTSFTAASSPLRAASSVAAARAKRIVSGVANSKIKIATTHLRSLLAALATLVVMSFSPRSFEELVHQSRVWALRAVAIALALARRRLGARRSIDRNSPWNAVHERPAFFAPDKLPIEYTNHGLIHRV
jgi:hypothetical protein